MKKPSLLSLGMAAPLALVGCIARGVAAETPAQALAEIARKQPNAEHGAELFRHCVACHGANGMGSPDGDVPVIAGQHASVIAKQLADYRNMQRWDIRMEGIAHRKPLQGAQDVADVAAYASRLPRESNAAVGEGEYLEHGAQQYRKLCARCHGPSGAGNAERAVPKLAGQHYQYLLRQLYDVVDGRRPNLSTAHVRLLNGFVVEDFEGVADYLSRIR